MGQILCPEVPTTMDNTQKDCAESSTDHDSQKSLNVEGFVVVEEGPQSTQSNPPALPAEEISSEMDSALPATEDNGNDEPAVEQNTTPASTSAPVAESETPQRDSDERQEMEPDTIPAPALARREQSITFAEDTKAGRTRESLSVNQVFDMATVPKDDEDDTPTKRHLRSKSEGRTLSMEDANRLHASWSNADSQDFSAFPSTVFSPASSFHSRHSSTSFMDEPRLSAVSLTRINSLDDSGFDQNTVSSAIHDAARITNWQTVKELCSSDPEAASYTGRDRWTALHHACNRRCPYPDVVEALIRAYPEALVQEEDKGWLPLHYACRFKAAKEVVRLLLHMDPEKGRTAVSRLDRQGRTPLYYAVRYDAPPGVVGLLLEVDATAVLEEDQNADSPLALVWDAWAEKLDGKRTLQRLYLSPEEADSMSHEEQARYVRKRLEGQRKLYDRWNKVDIFLKAAFGFKVDDDVSDENADCLEEKKDNNHGVENRDSSRTKKWRILHATAAIKCHPSLFMLAKSLYPEQAFEIDSKDLRGPVHISGDETAAFNLTPLHLAAASQANGDHGKLVINELLKMNPKAATQVDSEESLPLHRIVANKHKSHWSFDGAKDLYTANTAAVTAVDVNGRLPLHRAAQSIAHVEGDEEEVRQRSNICNLLALHPDGAAHADNYGCLPLHLVAQHGSEWDHQVQALYDAHPSGAQARTGVKLLNRLPLHMAAANPKSSFSLIVTLVRINPRGASQADRRGMFPIHLACEAGLSWESINVIYNAYPEALQEPERNKRGWTALQMAASCTTANEEVISNMARLYPAAAEVADGNGRSAFHLACLAGKKWDEGLSALFDANPDAVRTPDNVGLLPLHIASLRYSAPPVKSPLSRPTTISPKNRGFSKAASFDIEQSKKKEHEDANRVENLFQLLRADPAVLSTY